MAENKVYMNPMQREVLGVSAHTTVVVAGRGTGKGMLRAAWNLRNIQTMPGSTTGCIVPNSKLALITTIPSMLMHLENWGYKRDLHWVIGKRPPKKFDWPSPVIPPENWENTIAFYNGSIIQIVSQERKGTSNSKSFDALDIDEAKYIDFQQLKEETFPANRGQVQEFGACPHHHGLLICSDMSLTKRGSWFMDYEGKATPDLIEHIRAVAAEMAFLRKRQEVEGENAPAYLSRRIRELGVLLAELRRRCVYFAKYSSLANLEVLGEEYIRQQKRDLPPLVFQASILCLEVRYLKDGFYSSLRPHHIYKASNEEALERLGYQSRPVKADSRFDADVNPRAPLCIAFDYNANINWMVVGQPDYQERKLRVLRSFFVKYERKLEELICDFDAYYKHHPTREVVFYYDATARGTNYAVNKEDFEFVIRTKLRALGWRVQPIYIGRTMNHIEKHLLINRGLDGKGDLMPVFNEEGNEYLLISIQSAGVYNGKKDKRGEKLAETEADKLEARTDGSDAFDTLYIGCAKWKAGRRIAGTVGGG